MVLIPWKNGCLRATSSGGCSVHLISNCNIWIVNMKKKKNHTHVGDYLVFNIQYDFFSCYTLRPRAISILPRGIDIIEQFQPMNAHHSLKTTTLIKYFYIWVLIQLSAIHWNNRLLHLSVAFSILITHSFTKHWSPRTTNEELNTGVIVFCV